MANRHGTTKNILIMFYGLHLVSLRLGKTNELLKQIMKKENVTVYTRKKKKEMTTLVILAKKMVVN